MQELQIQRLVVMGAFIGVIFYFHYTTSTMKWHYHLILMQCYFIPILIGAFQFGIKGGFGTAIVVSLIYSPHVMIQWGGLVEANLMRFLQIALFNVVGYLTGLTAQKELDEKERYQQTAKDVEKSLEQFKEADFQVAIAHIAGHVAYGFLVGAVIGISGYRVIL
jgi:hypothetical protein